MTDPTTLLALAERCEQAAGPDQKFVMLAVLDVLKLPSKQHYALIRMIEAGAYESAAIALVPEGWRYDLTNGDLVSEEKPAARLTPDFAGPCFEGYAQTVSFALWIPVLRARAAAHE
jgi:hypothetical protein